MNSLVITGGNGFLGSNVLIAMAKHFPATQVECMSFPRSQTKWPKTNYKILLAGGYSPKSAVHFDLSEARREKEFVERLLQDGRDLCNQVWLVSSTDASSVADTDYASATAPHWAEPTQYGEHKREMERLTQDICKKFGLRLVIVRLGPLYGPGEEAYQRLIPEKIKSAAAGRPLHFDGLPGFQRPFLYSKDAAQVLSILIHSDIPDGTYDLVGREQIDWHRIENSVDAAVRANRMGITSNKTSVEFGTEYLVRDKTIQLLNSTKFEDGILEEVRKNFTEQMGNL